MKKALSISLTLLILAGYASGDLTAYLAFKINQKQIAQAWCINKSKPERKCCGKCYLKHQLQKNKKAEKDQLPVPGTNNHESIVFFLSNHTIQLPGLLYADIVTGFRYKQEISQLLTADIFHPPAVEHLFSIA